MRVGLSYKLLPDEEQVRVFYKVTRQEGKLLAYTVDNDTYAILLDNGRVEYNIKKEQICYL